MYHGIGIVYLMFPSETFHSSAFIYQTVSKDFFSLIRTKYPTLSSGRALFNLCDPINIPAVYGSPYVLSMKTPSGWVFYHFCVFPLVFSCVRWLWTLIWLKGKLVDLEPCWIFSKTPNDIHLFPKYNQPPCTEAHLSLHVDSLPSPDRDSPLNTLSLILCDPQRGSLVSPQVIWGCTADNKPNHDTHVLKGAMNG